MNQDALISAVMLMPAIRGITMSDSEKRTALEAQLPSVKTKILYSYDWDFAIDEKSTVTVADQAAYVLKGNANDCRDIINIRYGSSAILIDRMRQVDFDEWYTYRTLTSVAKWVPDGREEGFPRVRLYSTPSVAGEAILYRYRRTDVTISEFPDDFAFVFQSGLAMRMIPGYDKVFKDDLGDMIKMYNFGGGEDNQIKQDPSIVLRNNKRATLYGYGGGY